MSLIVYDLNQLYRQYFGGNPVVPKVTNQTVDISPYRINGSNDQVTQIKGSALTADYLGKEVWLPIKFVNLNSTVFGASELLLPYAVIEMDAKKTIVKTALAERRGTVKELYSIDDFTISIKGFLIDNNRVFPEEELTILNKLWELNEAIEFDNALSNIFLDKDTRVVIEDLKLPAVENGWKHIRPFSMKLESDSIFTLDV
jgi:hypothetical protein